MKARTLSTFIGVAVLASACAVQPYRADINTFEGLIKVNPKDVRECEAYAKVKAEPEETLEMDLAYGVLSGVLFGALASTDRTASLLVGGITGSNYAIRSIENKLASHNKACLQSRGYIVNN